MKKQAGEETKDLTLIKATSRKEEQLTAAEVCSGKKFTKKVPEKNPIMGKHGELPKIQIDKVQKKTGVL